MKLHLPLSLRHLLLAVVSTAPAWAGVLTSEINQVVYADFGQNFGRYSVTNVNELLSHIQDGGIKIPHKDGSSYTLEHGMISFESRQEDGGASAAVNYNFIATVKHNGVQRPYFSYVELGGSTHAIRYSGIECPGTKYVHDASGRDFKITRLSKIVTDVTTSEVYSSQKLSFSGLAGEYLYHSGGGATYIYNPQTGCFETIDSTGTPATEGHFLAGAVQQIGSLGGNEKGGFWMFHNVSGWDLETHPLPFGSRNGDSGSPVWVWDDEDGEYKYLAAVSQWGDDITYGVSDGNLKYIEDTTASYNKTIATSSGEITIGATISTGEGDSVLWQGQVTDAKGNSVTFTGVENGKSTWMDMRDIRDEDNWYALTDSYLNAQQNHTDASKLGYSDLFGTDNLVFNANDRTDYTIQVDSVVDTGIGYTEFTKGNQDKASYTISGKGYLDSAGYIIGEDVDVHLRLLSADKTREVRKIGDGTLYVDGTGDNDIMLNLGGKGKTILNQTNGYAAYNVLANNGTTVQLLGGISQIKRDFTFGNGGGTLDFHGHDWEEGAEGHFSMKALTQDAILANSKKDSSSEITFTAGGTYLGSFRDDKTANAALKINYTGTGTWTLNSIHTRLEHAGSGLFVNSGKVELVGMETQHAASNLAGTDKPWQNPNDWHYADAAMNVTVNGGATFELGSHARLTGDVTVNANGTYIMREGVQNRYEYIEGGYTPEDTDKISDYFGHKGDTILNNGGKLQVEFCEGTTSTLTYAGSISGIGGSMTVNTADGTLYLTGDNDEFKGSKEITDGHVIAKDQSAAGAGSAWLIGEGTTLSVQSGITSSNLATYVNTSSTGMLAVGSNVDKVIQDSSLYIGAADGATVQYGSAVETITAPKLSSAGGTLEVRAAVNAGNLVIGREGDSGVVRLVNGNNELTGTISMQGNVALDITAAALGDSAKVKLDYGKALMLRESLADTGNMITADSTGALLLDSFNGDNLDMTSISQQVSLSAAGEVNYGGTITAADTYHLGGHIGTLKLTNASALSAGKALLVDGKGTSGGRIVIGAQQSNFSGAVTVQGTAGNITLEYAVDNALAGATTTTIKNGGILDIGTTTQTLKQLIVQEGGCVTAEKGSLLSIDMGTASGDNYFQKGSYLVDEMTVSGTEFVLASDKNEWNKLTVQKGTKLFTRVDNALSATGITRVENGATLNLNTWSGNGYTTRTMHGNIELADGATMITGSGSYDVYLTASFKVDANATAVMDGGKWHLEYGAYNKDGGTISFKSDALYFDYSAAQSIGGTLKVDDNTTFYGQQDSNSKYTQGREVQLNHLEVSAGKTLTVNDNKGKTAWQFDKLSGSGNITWTSDWGAGIWANGRSARMTIGGDGEYAGTIELNRSYAQGAHRYQAFIEITGNEAVSQAVISLNGSGTNDNASLAINTGNAKLRGLRGNSYSHLFAGPAPSGSASSSAPFPDKAANTLTFTSSAGDEYTYSGTVAGDMTNGLVLVQGGAGKQYFNGSSVSLRGVEIQNTGTLDFSQVGQNGFMVHGNIVLGAAGSLNMGDHDYSLDAGKTLSVGAAGASLTMGNLQLNGGTMSFDAGILSRDGVTLNYTGGIENLAGASILFTNVTQEMLGEENKYLLAGGSWDHAIIDDLRAGELGSIKANFGITENNQLYVYFDDNAFVWGGQSGDWASGSFNGTTGIPNESSNVSFKDDALYKNISLASDTKVASVYFVNSEENDYNISGDGTLTADYITQSGSGDTVISAETIVKTIEVKDGRLELQNADLNSGHLMVQNGTLAVAIASNETIPYLHLLDGARLEASNCRLTIDHGTTKQVNTTMELVALDRGTIYDYKSAYIVNEGGVLSVGDVSCENNNNTILGTIEMKNNASLHVEAGNLGIANGLILREGISSVSIADDAIVAFGAEKTISTTEGSDASAVIDVENASLYMNGTKTGDALKIRLGDGAQLGSSNVNDCEAIFDCNIVLAGDACLVSDSVYQSTYNIRRSASIQGAVVYTGTISSEKKADLTIGSGNGGLAVISGKAEVSGDLKVAAGNCLGVAASTAYSIVENPDFSREVVQTAGVQISSRNGSAAATISGGSSLVWDGSGSTASIAGNAAGSTVMNNALVELYSSAKLSLQNIVLGADSRIAMAEENAADGAEISVSRVGLQVIEGINASSQGMTALENSLTLKVAGGDATLTLAAGSRVLEVTTNAISGGITLTGQSMVVNFDAYNLEDYDAVKLIFANNGVQEIADSVSITGTASPAQLMRVAVQSAPLQMTGTYDINNTDGSVYFLFTTMVPEPTSTTLSLLALCGLAVRRRRK